MGEIELRVLRVQLKQELSKRSFRSFRRSLIFARIQEERLAYNLRCFQAFGYTFLQGHENGFAFVHPETAQAWQEAHQELDQISNPFSYASMLAQAVLTPPDDEAGPSESL